MILSCIIITVIAWQLLSEYRREILIRETRGSLRLLRYQILGKYALNDLPRDEDLRTLVRQIISVESRLEEIGLFSLFVLPLVAPRRARTQRIFEPTNGHLDDERIEFLLIFMKFAIQQSVLLNLFFGALELIGNVLSKLEGGVSTMSKRFDSSMPHEQPHVIPSYRAATWLASHSI